MTIAQTAENNVANSITDIYAKLVERRNKEKEDRDAAKLLAKSEKPKDDVTTEKPLTKKQKKEAKIATWSEILIGLRGEDLDYIRPKKSKKKYKKWIDDDVDTALLFNKSKKKKKRNYNKEFEPELNMLKNLIADQNRFAMDLLKRWNTMAGPATKDAMPLNKNLIELAGVLNNARGNSLSTLREIGNVKKTIAELYFKQKKEDRESGTGNSFDSGDQGLMGAQFAQQLFAQSSSPAYSQPNSPGMDTPPSINDLDGERLSKQMFGPSSTPNVNDGIQDYDPSKWDGDGLSAGAAAFENTSHKFVVELHPDDTYKFKAVGDDGQEIVGPELPQRTIKTIDKEGLRALDDFNQVYDLEIIS